jgi:hypothetical protein
MGSPTERLEPTGRIPMHALATLTATAADVNVGPPDTVRNASG